MNQEGRFAGRGLDHLTEPADLVEAYEGATQDHKGLAIIYLANLAARSRHLCEVLNG
jgi:hypothetical protein